MEPSDKLAINRLYINMCSQCSRPATYSVATQQLKLPLCWRHLRRFLRNMGHGSAMAISLERR